MVSLGNVCRWLGSQAEALGVEIYPGFAAAEVLYAENGSVRGVATGDMGVGRDGSHLDNYAPGMELLGKYTFFAEGCRGQLGKQLEAKFELRQGIDPQTYGIGLKELWEVNPNITSRAWWCIPRVGRWTAVPTAVPLCTTWKTTWSRSAL